MTAIWRRVSSDAQRAISPETQIREGLALAAEEGYHVPEEFILGTDWHSLTVWESPPFERLKFLIQTGPIQAVFLYDPDRAPLKPAHRLLFRALTEECGVKIICRYGQVPDGDMGELMEFVLDCLDARATVGPSGMKLSLAVPEETLSSVSTQPRLG